LGLLASKANRSKPYLLLPDRSREGRQTQTEKGDRDREKGVGRSLSLSLSLSLSIFWQLYYFGKAKTMSALPLLASGGSPMSVATIPPPPLGMAMYCRSPILYVAGWPRTPAPVWNFHSSSPVVSLHAIAYPSW